MHRAWKERADMLLARRLQAARDGLDSVMELVTGSMATCAMHLCRLMGCFRMNACVSCADCAGTPTSGSGPERVKYVPEFVSFVLCSLLCR